MLFTHAETLRSVRRSASSSILEVCLNVCKWYGWIPICVQILFVVVVVVAAAGGVVDTMSDVFVMRSKQESSAAMERHTVMYLLSRRSNNQWTDVLEHNWFINPMRTNYQRQRRLMYWCICCCYVHIQRPPHSHIHHHTTIQWQAVVSPYQMTSNCMSIKPSIRWSLMLRFTARRVYQIELYSRYVELHNASLIPWV